MDSIIRIIIFNLRPKQSGVLRGCYRLDVNVCLSACLCMSLRDSLWHRSSQTDRPTLMRFFH